MSVSYFVTGTDTDVGKTLIAAALLHLANQAGKSTLGLKPVAAGCAWVANGHNTISAVAADETSKENGEWRNDDAELLQQFSSVKLPYSQINPVALQAAIAPHVAAAQEGKRLQVSRIAGMCRGALMAKSDVCLVEGAGGWRVPLNPRETMADIAKSLNLGVILVVGLRLGCINHGLLTAEAIVRDGLRVVGWVGNEIDPNMAAVDESFNTLQALIAAPCLGRVPFISQATPQAVAAFLDMAPLGSPLPVDSTDR